MFAHSSVNAAGIGQAEVELSGDSLVGGSPTALLCLPFFSHYAHGHVSSDAIKKTQPPMAAATAAPDSLAGPHCWKAASGAVLCLTPAVLG